MAFKGYLFVDLGETGKVRLSWSSVKRYLSRASGGEKKLRLKPRT